MSIEEQSNGVETERPEGELEQASLPAMHQNASICNIWQSALPGVDPKAFQHKVLSPRQMAAVYLLLQGLSEADAASRLGINRTTVYRWKTQLSSFKQELDAQRRALWQRANDRLGAMISPAMNLLERQLERAESDGNTRNATYVAGTILRMALRHRPETPEQEHRRADRNFSSALDAYINAPMPGRTHAEDAAACGVGR